MKKLYLHPLFIIGLVIRVALIIGTAPLAVTNWYVPFLDVSTSALSYDPWSEWIYKGETVNAFPYGYAMWLAFLPLSLLAKLFGYPQIYAYKLTLFAADLLLLLTLRHHLPGRQRLLLLAYWLSPIVILASYGLGLNDLIPALLLTLSILLVRRVELAWAGALFAAAISSKLSMVVALPYFGIYLFNSRVLRQRFPDFIKGFGIGTLVLGLPFISSRAALKMLLENPEMDKIFQFSIGLTGNVSLYLVPLIYLVMIYLIWRVRRLNYDLFQATIGIAFLLIVLLTPASPGWFIWSIPFLTLYQAMSGRIAIVLIAIFSFLYSFSTLLAMPLQCSDWLIRTISSKFIFLAQLEDHSASLIHTAMVAIGLILAMRIWREAIDRNDFFRLSRKPFVIGIAGDSGAGKDTFADAISGLFGNHSIVKLSGDDYHLWDRQKPMWQVMTHLNPMANDLEGYCNDLVSLTDGKSILSRHYDHNTGKMSKPFRIYSNDFIIASGLHALYLPVLRDCYNLKIYLDIDEGLRRHFKIRRDVLQRGHALERVLNSIEKRESDSKRFIRPQSSYADLTLSLQPIQPRILDLLDDKHTLRLKLIVNTKNGFSELSIHRILVGICGLHVDIVVGEDGSAVQMTIEGDVSADDIAIAAEILCPRVFEFLDISPKWQDGMLGLMQLITLSHINQALTKRFIS